MDQTSRVEELVSQFEQLLKDGQFVHPEELCSDDPELLSEVQERIAKLEPRISDETMESNDLSTNHAEVDLEEEEFAESATVVEEQTDDSSFGALVMTHNYRKLRFHARGGLGEIYIADDSQLRRDVVLKFIKGKHSKRRDCNEQFRLEAEITARLDHPGVVSVYGFGRTPDGRLCYAMRFIQGDTLDVEITKAHAPKKDGNSIAQSFFHRDRIIELRKMLGEFISVCQTIAYANNRGILHRDIKPDNIMIGKYGDTLVVDWGLAMPVNRDDSAKASGEVTLMPSSNTESSGGSGGGPVGTPAFMSPEQATGVVQLTPATDIFSLGAMLYKMLTGRAPYRGDSARETLTKARHGSFEPPRELNSDIPLPLEAICLKAMEFDPDKRYLSSLDLAADIERFLADEPVTAHTESKVAKSRRWMRKNRGKTQAILSLILVSVVSLSVWATSSVLQEKNLVEIRVNSLRNRAEINETLIQNSFNGLKGDVKLVVTRPVLVDAAKEFDTTSLKEAQDLKVPSEAKEKLSKLFVDFLALNPNYMQVRYLDKSGHERVRVDRIKRYSETARAMKANATDQDGNIQPVEHVWDDKLADDEQASYKKNRSYFTNTFNKPSDTVIFSKIEINSESSGKQWNTPVIRACAPVWGDDECLGVVVINMHFHEVVDTIKKAVAPDVRVYLTDNQGRFLHFDGEEDLDFSFERRTVEREMKYKLNSIFDELVDFAGSGDPFLENSSVQPRLSLFIKGKESESTDAMWDRIKNALSREDRLAIREELTKYSDKELKRGTQNGGDARPMAVLVGDDDLDMERVKEDVAKALGEKYSVDFVPKPDALNRHAFYCRKVVFDTSNPDEGYLCLLLVLCY
jgi:serine/threonine protein kinase